PLTPGEHGSQGVDREQLPDEKDLRPRPGDRAKVGGKELAWQEYHSPEPVLDLNAVMGKETERSVAYAVCYIESDRERDGLWLQVGGDDRAKVYLNGREIYRSRSSRMVTAQDAVGLVRLERGINVLLLKVVNERELWQCCAR